jgi:hypothetical protein
MSCWQSSPRASTCSGAAKPERSATACRRRPGTLRQGQWPGYCNPFQAAYDHRDRELATHRRGRRSDLKPGTEGRPGRATRRILQKPARSRRSHAAIPSDGVAITAFAASASCQERASADAKREPAGIPGAPSSSGYGTDPFHQYTAYFRGLQPHRDRAPKGARSNHAGGRAVGACTLRSLHRSPHRTVEKHASNGAPVALTRPLARRQIKGTRRCARAPARRSPGP